MNYRNHKSPRQYCESALRLVTILGILCQAQLGCYHDHEGEVGPAPPSAPGTFVFDYRVTDLASGTTFTSGCGAAWRHNDLSNAIIAKVPLGTEYMLELTSFRGPDGTLNNHDAAYFCSLPYQPGPIYHTNPSCYRSLGDSGIEELIEASVLDTNGNLLTSAYSDFEGASTDFERFKLRAKALGTVTLSSDGPPCNGAAGAPKLLTIQSP